MSEAAAKSLALASSIGQGQSGVFARGSLVYDAIQREKAYIAGMGSDWISLVYVKRANQVVTHAFDPKRFEAAAEV